MISHGWALQANDVLMAASLPSKRPKRREGVGAPGAELIVAARLTYVDGRGLFMVVAAAGTVGRAANGLAVSQPVISKAIADLEYVLGVRLFDRSRRGVHLTDYGLSLRNSGIAVFDDLRDAVKRLQVLANPDAGEVRLGTTEPLATGPVSAALDTMATRYPKMTFHLLQTDLATLSARDLRARTIEFAVARIFEPFSRDEFATEVLFNDLFAVVVGRNSKWARRRRVALADRSRCGKLSTRDNPSASSIPLGSKAA